MTARKFDRGTVEQKGDRTPCLVCAKSTERALIFRGEKDPAWRFCFICDPCWKEIGETYNRLVKLRNEGVSSNLIVEVTSMKQLEEELRDATILGDIKI